MPSAWIARLSSPGKVAALARIKPLGRSSLSKKRGRQTKLRLAAVGEPFDGRFHLQ